MNQQLRWRDGLWEGVQACRIINCTPHAIHTLLADDGPNLAGGAAWNEGLPPLGGHSLNRAPDPVMSAPELTAMLEELGFVPQCVSRQDVTEVFRAVTQVRRTAWGAWECVRGE